MVSFNELITVLMTISLLTGSLAAQSIRRKTFAGIAAEFTAAAIVPDIVPCFNPVALAYLTFSYPNGTSTTITYPGEKIGRNDSQIAPAISIRGLPSSSKRYLGVIVDPDAPTRANPTLSQIRHYLAPDLTIGASSLYVEDSLLLSNQTIETPAANDYRGPNPPAGSGPHRYIFFLYAQPEDFDYSSLNVTNIRNFNLSDFVEQTKLGEPLAGTYFLTEVSNATTVAA